MGFLLGLKHAVEADHLAAVSTMVAERKGMFRSALVGGLWGVGHTISLLGAGIMVLLLNLQISERTEQVLELCVGVMLVLLGLNVMHKLIRRGRLHFYKHRHGRHAHEHPYVTEFAESDQSHKQHGFALHGRSVIIGMVHGLAGSAALMLLVIPTIESQLMGLLYIIIFGLGSIGGMMIMSFLVGLPFQITALRFNRFNLLLQSIAGLISVSLGLLIAYEHV